MSQYLSEAGLCRALGFSLPKIKRAIRLGIIQPSGKSQRGALYDGSFVHYWRQMISMDDRPKPSVMNFEVK